MKTISNAFLNRGDLTEINKVWFYLVNSVFKPSKHVSTIRQDHTLLLYVLAKGFELNMGKIIKESIFDYDESKFLGNIPHLSQITLFCIKGGVRFKEVEEERCPKASPLTFAGALKALVDSEERERREKNIKMKRAEIVEQPREPTLTYVPEEESSSEEMRGFEAYSEKPVLSSTADEATPAPTRAKERGKRRVEAEGSSTTELLFLLKEMEDEMRERDEQLKEKLRWRDNHLDEQKNKRENSLAATL